MCIYYYHLLDEGDKNKEPTAERGTQGGKEGMRRWQLQQAAL